MLSYSKGSRGLFVPSRVIGIFTDTTISLSSRLRQRPDHYTIRVLQCYTDVTGKPGKAFAIGGGTYVHHLKNGVAFGCADLEVDNRMHGADEFVEIECLKQCVVIFAEAILRICGE